MKNKLIIIFLLFSTSLMGQRLLEGKVVDQNKVPISYANLSIGQSLGTASDEKGNFLIQIPPEKKNERIKISCIGYQSTSLSIDSLSTHNENQLIIILDQAILVLNEVTIVAQRLSARDVVQQAILDIPKNYYQNPFNMEFFSKILVKDTTKIFYEVESIINSYRDGYVEGAENVAKMIERRESGESPISNQYDKERKMNFFSYERMPIFDIFLADLIGIGSKYDYTIFNPGFFKKVDFEFAGVTNYETDTVNIISYRPKGRNPKKESDVREGVLYISTKDNAIVWHKRRIGRIIREAGYRKWGDYYYPYFIKSAYSEVEGNKMYDVVIENYIRTIITKDVTVYNKDVEKWYQYLAHWHMSDVPYNRSFWDKNYPR